MKREKLNGIIESMQGVTYHEWQKIQASVDIYFKLSINDYKREMTISEPGDIVDLYGRDWEFKD